MLANNSLMQWSKREIDQPEITTTSDLQPIDLDDMQCWETNKCLTWQNYSAKKLYAKTAGIDKAKTSTDNDFMADELQCRHVQSKSQLPVRFVRYRLDSTTAAINVMPDVSQSSRPAAAESTVIKSKMNTMIFAWNKAYQP